MIQAVSDLNNNLWYRFEEAITPIPRGSNESKIMHALPAIVLLPALVTGFVASAIQVANDFFVCQRRTY